MDESVNACLFGRGEWVGRWVDEQREDGEWF